MKSLSIITISYNSEDFIEKFLTSIIRYKPKQSEIIILDNASTDGTVEIIKKFPEIKLIRSKENLGFSKGNNLAAKEASGEYLFFLNPDTEILKQLTRKSTGLPPVQNDGSELDQLVEFYEKTPDCGIVAPRLEMEDGETQTSVRKLPTIWGAFKEYILGIKHAYSEYVPKTDQPIEVESVYGAAILIKKDLFEKLNGFDEKFFLYYEDVDLCKRVREANKKVYYYPGASIKHLVGATKTNKDRYRFNLESVSKYHGSLGAFILYLIFWVPRILRKLGLP